MAEDCAAQPTVAVLDHVEYGQRSNPQIPPTVQPLCPGWLGLYHPSIHQLKGAAPCVRTAAREH